MDKCVQDVYSTCVLAKNIHTNKRTNENTKKTSIRACVHTFRLYKRTHLHAHIRTFINTRTYTSTHPRVETYSVSSTLSTSFRLICFFSYISYTKTQIIDAATKYCFLRQFLCQKIGHCCLSPHSRDLLDGGPYRSSSEGQKCFVNGIHRDSLEKDNVLSILGMLMLEMLESSTHQFLCGLIFIDPTVSRRFRLINRRHTVV